MSQTIASGGPAPAGAVSPLARPRARRLDLDRAKGIAILLVVLGHIVAREQPPGVEWYEPFRYAVYRFHMPFFLYLSGTVVVNTDGSLPLVASHVRAHPQHYAFIVRERVAGPPLVREAIRHEIELIELPAAG